MYAFEESTLATKIIHNIKLNKSVLFELKYSPTNDFSTTLHLDFYKDGQMQGHVQYINDIPLYQDSKDANKVYKKEMPFVVTELLKQITQQ